MIVDEKRLICEVKAQRRRRRMQSSEGLHIQGYVHGSSKQKWINKRTEEKKQARKGKKRRRRRTKDRNSLSLSLSLF